LRTQIKNRVLRKTYGTKMKEVLKTGEKCIMRSFTICNPYLILLYYRLKVRWWNVCHRSDREEGCIQGICVKTRGKMMTLKT